jgi:hypothetical protein
MILTLPKLKHDDLRRQLHSLCVDSGVVFKHGKAMNIVEMENGAAVTLENGERFEADIVRNSSFKKSCSLIVKGCRRRWPQ